MNVYPAHVAAPSLPHPEVLLQDTGWEALGSALGGDSRWLPYVLRALLHPDPVVQSAALDDLEPIRHQNTIYPATVPAAVYIAAILSDFRTASVCRFGRDRWTKKDHHAPLRAELIAWLGSLAVDSDWAGDVDTFVVRTMWPALFNAIVPYLDDDDRTTRCAAITTASILAAAPELINQREAITDLYGSLDAQRENCAGCCWKCGGLTTARPHNEPLAAEARQPVDRASIVPPSADTLMRAARVWAAPDPWAGL